MLLQQIVGTLDAELDRLLKLREIVHDLGHASAVIENLDAEIEAPLHPEMIAQIQVLPIAVAPIAVAPVAVAPITVARSKRGSRNAKPVAPVRRVRQLKAVEPSAFTKVIPAGPVVVSAEALSHERKHRVVATRPAKAQQAEPVVESPKISENLVRDLSQRWLSRQDGHKREHGS